MPQILCMSRFSLPFSIAEMAQEEQKTKDTGGKMSVPMNPKILNLMQFARKAGKLVSGTDACLRAMHHKHIHIIVVADDTALRTISRLEYEIRENNLRVEIIRMGSQEELSAALGLPITGVFGISDKNFAAKISEYWQA